jgi:hypothetical protein
MVLYSTEKRRLFASTFSQHVRRRAIMPCLAARRRMDERTLKVIALPIVLVTLSLMTTENMAA